MSSHAKHVFMLPILLCAMVCSAIEQHTTIQYPRALRRLTGKLTGYGAINPGAQIRIFNNAQVWLDDSLSFQEARRKQTKVAQQESNEQGRFDFGQLPDGFYEVEFSRDGWDSLSVLVRVERHGAKDKVCVELRIDSGPGADSAKRCP